MGNEAGAAEKRNGKAKESSRKLQNKLQQFLCLLSMYKELIETVATANLVSKDTKGGYQSRSNIYIDQNSNQMLLTIVCRFGVI